MTLKLAHEPHPLTASAPASLFGASDVPQVLTDSDPASVELGVKWRSALEGKLTAIRFYKGPQNVGHHTASLWEFGTGKLLVSAPFANESRSGWQGVALSAPIRAGTDYVASYHAAGGHYAVSPFYFLKDHVSGPLTAPGGANGLYVYSAKGSYPSQTWQSCNYFVDVTFVPVLTTAVQLSWDASPTASVTGYRVKYGTSPGVYTGSVDAGTALSATLNLPPTPRHYYVVIAHDAAGHESPASNEISS